MAATGPTAAEGRILFVCTANICRSPMAERWTAGFLAEQLGDANGRFEVGSAGVQARDGSPMAEYAASTLTSRGIDPSGFRSRALREEHLRGPDLVLVASRRHRAKAAALDPRMLRRCFTIREFGRLAEATEPVFDDDAGAADRLRTLVREAAGMRGLVPPPEHPEDYDLADPIGGTPGQFAACLDTIVAALEGPWRRLKP
jgi:protein-tyrosine phosphatase